ncbi:hypothetical protein J1N35_038130, partial [Gossypium stocksii]
MAWSVCLDSNVAVAVSKDFINNTNLYKFKDIDMENVIKYLTQDSGTWNRRPDTSLPTNFNQVIMFLVAKIWVQFIGTRIALALNFPN